MLVHEREVITLLGAGSAREEKQAIVLLTYSSRSERQMHCGAFLPRLFEDVYYVLLLLIFIVLLTRVLE